LLGAHKYGCSRADSACSTADASPRLDEAAEAEHGFQESFARWLYHPPRPSPPPVLNFIVGVAVIGVFVLGLALIGMGIGKSSLSMSFGGIALLVGSWFIARMQPGALWLQGVGTAFYGETELGTVKIHTKWLCFFVPLLPVRSFYVLTSEAYLEGPHDIKAKFRHFPLPGLGLHWSSVGRTAVWGLLALLIAITYSIFNYSR